MSTTISIWAKQFALKIANKRKKLKIKSVDSVQRRFWVTKVLMKTNFSSVKSSTYCPSKLMVLKIYGKLEEQTEGLSEMNTAYSSFESLTRSRTVPCVQNIFNVGLSITRLKGNCVEQGQSDAY